MPLSKFFIRSILKSSASLSRHFHLTHHKDPFFIPKHVSFHNKNPPFVRRNVFRSMNTQVLVEASNLEISKDSEKLCKILTDSSSLDSFGIANVSLPLVVEVLKKLSNAGALALTFFRWVEKKEGYKHTNESYNALIEALGKIKQFNSIWDIVEEMKGKGLVTKETFGLIMRRYARCRKTKEAIETFKKMEKFGMKHELSDYNRLIDTLSKARHVQEAQQVFDEMKKKKRFMPDVKTYSILLEGWGEERNLEMVEDLCKRMKDEGLEPDVVTYGIVINAYCKSKKYDEALEIFRGAILAKNLKPSPHIYCSLIHGLGAEKRLNEAIDFFEQSKISGFVPELPTYNALVGAYCWSERFKDACMVLEEMKKSGVLPNSRTYEIIIHHLIKNRRTKDAYRVFQEMESKFGCEPSANTYEIIVRMFCSEEGVDMALQVWSQMKAKGILPSMHMFSSLINGLSRDNKLDEACAYFQEMLDSGIRPPGPLFGNLKQALLEAGKKELALSFGLKLDKIRKTRLVIE